MRVHALHISNDRAAAPLESRVDAHGRVSSFTERASERARERERERGEGEVRERRRERERMREYRQ